MPLHLDPTAPIAPDALLTDDPKGAMDLAVALCDSPRMSNLAHGLWGYYGTTAGGFALTVQSLGIGGPSAAAVMADLARLGVSRAIRIGSCNALNGDLTPGSRVIATGFEPADGAGRSLAGGTELNPDSALTDALARWMPDAQAGVVRSSDLDPGTPGAGSRALAGDLSSAAFAAAGAGGGIACACALLVCGAEVGGLRREEREEGLIDLGRLAAAALGAVPQAPGP